MKVTTTQVERLLTGSYSFSQLGFSMLVTRLKNLYARDPASLQSCTNEINMFLDKFQGIMGSDFTTITKL